MSMLSKTVLAALAALFIHGSSALPTNQAAPVTMIKRQAGGSLEIDLVNNFDQPINAYLSGTDENSNKFGMLGTDGQWYYPQAAPKSSMNPIDAANITIPLNGPGEGPKRITVPSYVTGGRLWFAAGDLHFFTNVGDTGVVAPVMPSAANPADPSYNTLWGFSEFTNTAAGGLYVNPSQVDFVGLPVGISVASPTGGPDVSTPGLKKNAVGAICDAMKLQTQADGWPWQWMCRYSPEGNLLRVVSPGLYRGSAYDPKAFDGDYDWYVKDVWEKYTASPLTLINNNTASGHSICQVQGEVLACSEDETPYAKPSIQDIWGCDSGPFANAGSKIHQANVATLCAAFHRSTLLLPGGETQPGLGVEAFYTDNTTDWYSKAVHANSADGRGYSFAYDDVKLTDGTGEDGTIAMKPPGLVTITVGGV
ncbi:hypothetical protein PRZ48_002368 [Zasmidium cellare]|uniref:GH64 domain-containing protein n=1 Tax=Zasmidium cellare TaxID=395010 RepID=A0ABR0F3U9_ZASCE|nr:hypothetical protein PRZ48_002368 [Zasmidium cellare]